MPEDPPSKASVPDPRRSRKRQVTVRALRLGDAPAVARLSAMIYPHDEPWRTEHLASHLRLFPAGQLVAVEPDTGELLGYAASLIVNWDDYAFDHAWDEFTDRGWFTNHDPVNGKTLYGADVMVRPDTQGRGVGGAIYRARAELCRSLSLRRIRAGARLRGYADYADRLSPEAYVQAVIRGELRDPTLSFQLRKGFRVIAVVHGYLKADPASRGYAAVIEWINHRVARRRDYRQRDPRFARPRRRRSD